MCVCVRVIYNEQTLNFFIKNVNSTTRNHKSKSDCFQIWNPKLKSITRTTYHFQLLNRTRNLKPKLILFYFIRVYKTVADMFIKNTNSRTPYFGLNCKVCSFGQKLQNQEHRLKSSHMCVHNYWFKISRVSVWFRFLETNNSIFALVWVQSLQNDLWKNMKSIYRKIDHRFAENIMLAREDGERLDGATMDARTRQNLQ